MSPPPTIYTPPAELDGTVAGIVITAVVASLALVLLIGLVYWANSHPENRRPKAQRESARAAVPTADPRSVPPGLKKSGSTSPRAPARDEPYRFVLRRAEPDDTVNGD